MNNNNLHVLDFVLYGFHGKEDGKREKDSLYLQETVETGVEDGLATSCKVTSLEEDEDEFYDSVDRVVVNELGRETVSSLKFSGENVKQVEDFVAGTLNTTRSLKIQDVAIEDEIEDHEIPEIIDESPLTDPEERGLDNYASEGEAGGFSDDSNSRDRMEVREKGHKQRAKSANKKRRKSGDRKGHGSKAGGGTHHMTCEKLQKVKDTVEKAIRDHKTFTVQGSFPTIREAMKQRGWVEKEMHRYRLNPLDDSTYTVPFYASLTDLRNTESMLVARLLRSTKVDFLWTMRSEPIDWQDVHKKQLINRFPRAYFTTKVGLCAYLQNMHWFCENGVSHILFPRCYNVCHPEEMTAFIDDFRLTACLGLLKWLISKYEKDGETSIKSIEGKVPFTAVEFAIQRCNEYIGIQSHDDIDKFDNLSIWDHQWDQFLTWYYLAVHQDFLLMDCRRPAVRELYESAKKTLHDIRKFWPQLDLDGMGNIWIVKPGAKSRGRGIQLTNKLDKVMEKVNPATMKECRYVVQKYIEHPLLIYNTKFDIRQWFLVTCAQPLTIWMYKESYLRFCSQPFDLKNFHESVHLCNNAVQCKYKNGKRDPSLPDENMWDCYTFQTYLRGIGRADMWEKSIYPGMRESIICALLASQEHMDRRKNCFELYGADFMLDEDFSPWLIEINSCPCMSPSTSVTARMCAQCLEDVIKVVIDKRNDRRASTGMFELIYRQHIPRAPPYLGMSLSVRGTKVPYSAFFRSRIRSGNKIKKMRNSSEECSSPELSKQRKKKFTELKVTNFSGSEISEFEDSAKELLSDHSYVVRNAEILEENVDDKDRVISGIAKLKNLNYRQSKMKLTGLDELLFFDIGSEPILETENKPKNITESSSSDMFYDAEPESFQKIKPTLHIIKPPYTSFRNKSDKYKDDNDIKIGTSDVKNEEITVSNNNSHPKSENRNDINNFEQNLSKNNLLEVGNGNVVESTHSTNTFETASNTDNLEFSSATDISIGNSKNMNKNRNIISYTSSEEQNSGSEKKKALLKRTSRSSSEEKSSTSSSRQTCINKIEKRDISQEQISNTGKNLVKGNIRPKLIVESLAVKNPTKQLRESSDERESVSSGPELNLPKKKKMAKVKTLRLCSMECESASSEPDQNKKKKNIKIKKSRSNFKYLNSLRNRSEPNTGKNNWCNLSNEQKSVEANNYLHVPNEVKHDVNETESPELHNVPGCMLRGSKQEITRDSSEERELANIPFKFNKVYRRGTSIRKKKLLSSSDKERPTSEHSTPNNRREHSLDSSEDRDGFTSSSDNNLMKTVSAKKKSKDGRFLHNNNEQIVKDKSIKSVLNNSEISNIMNRSNDLKNNVISKNTETMLKQSNNNSLGLEHTETVNIKKTVQCIGPIIVDLIEDLAQQIEKSQRICNKTLIDYDNVNVNSKSIMEADVAYDTNQAEGNKEVERKENEVIDNDKKELNPKQESITSTKNYEHYSRKQTLPKMWSYSKSVLDESNSNTEDVLPKHKKPVGNSWKNSDDAERSMEFFNEWRQKLDRTKASCEDMLAKLKLVRDNECIINKSRYYSIDKAINWEKEIGNKPTISDIIKRLSQTQPEREFFMYKRYVDTLPVYTYSHNNDKTKRDACDLGMLIEDNINLMRKHSRRLCSESSDLKPTTDSHIPEKTPSPVIRGILPHIKQRMKQPPTNNLFCSGQRVDDFYAVGMSLKSLKVNQNKKQILLPLGSDHCQAVNSTIPTQAEKGFL